MGTTVRSWSVLRTPIRKSYSVEKGTAQAYSAQAVPLLIHEAQDQPFTAPATTPLTMYFCRKMKTTMDGSTAITMAVIAYCQSEVY